MTFPRGPCHAFSVIYMMPRGFVRAADTLSLLPDLLAAPTATFESILSLLSSYFVAEDEDKLMRWIRRMLRSPGVREKMDGWREEWSGLVREGKTDGVLL